MIINQRVKEFGAGLKEAWAPYRRDILVWEHLAVLEQSGECWGSTER
jgi:hypothetical protein